MSEALRELGDYISQALGAEVIDSVVALDELTVRIKRPAVCRVMTFLRDDTNCLCKCLMDVCGVDYPDRDERFEVVYNLLSLKHNLRIRVTLSCDEQTPVPSVTSIFSAAGWWEREAWDLFGIYFSGHVEGRYDEVQKRVVYEPVSLPQEYRGFDFISPWEGAKYILEDDDTASDDDG